MLHSDAIKTSSYLLYTDSDSSRGTTLLTNDQIKTRTSLTYQFTSIPTFSIQEPSVRRSSGVWMFYILDDLIYHRALLHCGSEPAPRGIDIPLSNNINASQNVDSMSLSSLLPRGHYTPTGLFHILRAHDLAGPFFYSHSICKQDQIGQQHWKRGTWTKQNIPILFISKYAKHRNSAEQNKTLT